MPSAELEMVVGLLRGGPGIFIGRDETDVPIEEVRARIESLIGSLPIAPDVTITPVDARGVEGEWVVSDQADAGRVVLYLHGGGYVICSVRTHRELACRLSRSASARLFLPEYRLAPEHPHPAAVDDALTAYRWLLEDEGVDPARLVVAGDSAGGGLTVATLVAARDAGLPMPAAAVCLSPWVDLEGIGDSMTTKAALDPMISAEGLKRGADMYLNGQDARTPLAAPLYADLTGLPPLLIQVGTAETLLDDSVRLAERARAAGVDVELEEWEDMIHVFQAFAGLLPEGQQAIDRVGEFVRSHTG